MQAASAILARHAFIDVETTGLDPSQDEVVELGVVFVEDGRETARSSWLFRPAKVMPPLVSALTGLAPGDLEAAPLLAELEPQIRHALAGWTLVAHNGNFERSFLRGLIADAPMVDSCELLHHLYPELRSHSLDSLVRWAGLGDGARHRALTDAEDTFHVVLTALARVIEEGRRADVHRLRTMLEPAETADQRALVGLLERLEAACLGERLPAVAAPPSPVDEPLVIQLEAWLQGPRVIADVETPEVFQAVLEAARRVSGRQGQTVVAVPSGRLREVPAGVPVLLTARRRACRPRGVEVCDARRGSWEERSARAWLRAWLDRTPRGDLSTLSTWLLERFPALPHLATLSRAAITPCEDDGCFTRKAEAEALEAPVVVVSHELALEWLERAPGTRAVFLDAQHLPEAAQRRGTVSLAPQRVTGFAGLLGFCGLDGAPLRACATNLTATLTQEQEALAAPLDPHTRLGPSWRLVRDTLHTLGRELARTLALLAADEGHANEALVREARELATLTGRFLDMAGAGLDTLVVPGETSPVLVQRPAPGALVPKLRVTLGGPVALLATLRIGEPVRWLEALGLDGHVPRHLPVSRRWPTVTIVSDPTSVPVAASRLAWLARAENGPVSVVSGAPVLLAAALAREGAGHVPVRARLTAEVEGPLLVLHDLKRGPRERAPLVVVVGAPGPLELRRLLVALPESSRRVLVLPTERVAIEPLVDALDGFPVRVVTAQQLAAPTSPAWESVAAQ